MRELHFFDPDGEVGVLERTLPHWSQSGVVSVGLRRSEIDGHFESVTKPLSRRC